MDISIVNATILWFVAIVGILVALVYLARDVWFHEPKLDVPDHIAPHTAPQETTFTGEIHIHVHNLVEQEEESVEYLVVEPDAPAYVTIRDREEWTEPLAIEDHPYTAEIAVVEDTGNSELVLALSRIAALELALAATQEKLATALRLKRRHWETVKRLRFKLKLVDYYVPALVQPDWSYLTREQILEGHDNLATTFDEIIHWGYHATYREMEKSHVMG